MRMLNTIPPSYLTKRSFKTIITFMGFQVNTCFAAIDCKALVTVSIKSLDMPFSQTSHSREPWTTI